MAFARAYELPTGGLTQELGDNGMGSLGIRLFNPFRKGKKGQRGRKWVAGLAALGIGGYFGGKKMGYWGTPANAVGNGGPAAYGPPAKADFMGPPSAKPQFGPPAPPQAGSAIPMPKRTGGGGNFLTSMLPALTGMFVPPPPQGSPYPMPQKASPMVPMMLGVGGIVALAVVVNIIKKKKKA